MTAKQTGGGAGTALRVAILGTGKLDNTAAIEPYCEAVRKR